jgi:hypothetical protein
MLAESRTIQILDPCPEEIPEERGLSERIPTLEGKTIGLLENRKYHADTFLLELQKVLEKDYGARKIVYTRKFTFSAPCADETINTLVEQCDAVIHGIAD